MVLTKSELVQALQHEVHILLHLVGKLDRAWLEYRPTPKQRTTLQLLQYLTIMGPELVKAAKRGAFDPEAWTAAEKAAAGRDFEATVDEIRAQKELYASLLADVSDSDFRDAVQPFGIPTTRGLFIVQMVLGGCAAYRTQLFLYLKACGREDMGTMNLWAGADSPA